MLSESKSPTAAFEAFLSLAAPAPASPAKIKQGKRYAPSIKDSNPEKGKSFVIKVCHANEETSEAFSVVIGMRGSFIASAETSPKSMSANDEENITLNVQSEAFVKSFSSRSLKNEIETEKNKTGSSAYLPKRTAISTIKSRTAYPCAVEGENTRAEIKPIAMPIKYLSQILIATDYSKAKGKLQLSDFVDLLKQHLVVLKRMFFYGAELFDY